MEHFIQFPLIPKSQIDDRIRKEIVEYIWKYGIKVYTLNEVNFLAIDIMDRIVGKVSDQEPSFVAFFCVWLASKIEEDLNIDYDLGKKYIEDLYITEKESYVKRLTQYELECLPILNYRIHPSPLDKIIYFMTISLELPGKIYILTKLLCSLFTFHQQYRSFHYFTIAYCALKISCQLYIQKFEGESLKIVYSVDEKEINCCEKYIKNSCYSFSKDHCLYFLYNQEKTKNVSRFLINSLCDLNSLGSLSLSSYEIFRSVEGCY